MSQQTLKAFGFKTPNSKDKKTQQHKQTYEKNRTRGFISSWHNEFPRLVHDTDSDKEVLFCSICQKHPTIADQQSSFIENEDFSTFQKQSKFTVTLALS